MSKIEILIALGIVWPVSSDKWKAPLNSNLELSLTPLSKRDTFGMGTRCPSGIIKKEFIKGSKERQGPTLGVCFTELPVFQRCLLRESPL